jgi:5-methylcytosine-specific restriction endonuclease McrA
MGKSYSYQCSVCDVGFESKRRSIHICPKCRSTINYRNCVNKKRVAEGLPPYNSKREKDKESRERTIKKCNVCGEFKPIDEGFHRSKLYLDGHCGRCKACVKEYKIKNAERIANNNRRWQKENPDKARAAQKRWHEKDAERARAQQVAAQHRRRVRIKAFDDFTLQDWRYALEYFNGCCAICGRQMNDMFGEFYPAQDHFIPLSKGGHNIPENIIPLCHGKCGCNNRKNATLPHEWLEREFGKRKAKEILERIEQFFTTVRKVIGSND